MFDVDDSAVVDVVGALPLELLAPYAELRAALALAPRAVGRPLHAAVPSGLRTATLGEGGRGIVSFLVEDDPRRVQIVQMTFY